MLRMVGTEQQQQSNLLSKVAIWSVWALYMQHVFLSDAPCGPAGGELCGISVPVTMEAINLSLNFWFVTPLVFPDLAPVVHPALEGLFNIVIAWGGLFLGFLSDGRRQRVPMLPFLVGTAFLTNVFYLPYLGLRAPLAEIEAGGGGDATVDPAALRVAEGRAWPLLMSGVFLASVLWACFGRAAGAGAPGAADFGDVAARWDALTQMALHTDRLAHSFLVDCLTFWVFQGALISDDLRRRGLPAAAAGDGGGGGGGGGGLGGLAAAAAAAGRLVPFFGLVGYLLWRPALLDPTVPADTPSS